MSDMTKEEKMEKFYEAASIELDISSQGRSVALQIASCVSNFPASIFKDINSLREDFGQSIMSKVEEVIKSSPYKTAITHEEDTIKFKSNDAIQSFFKELIDRDNNISIAGNKIHLKLSGEKFTATRADVLDKAKECFEQIGKNQIQ